MPIYEYQCQDCDHKLEKLQRMSDAPLVDCPSCEKPALKKLISAAAFRLKGSGWYETDFKKDGKRNLAEGSDAGKPTEKASDKSNGVKSDSSKPGDSKASSSNSSSGASSDSNSKSSRTKGTDKGTSKPNTTSNTA